MLPLFTDCYQGYAENHIKHLELATIETKKYHIDIFMPHLAKYHIDQITPSIVSDVLARLKQEASEKRFNFDRPLRELKAVFNWIIDRSEEPLSNPVRKFHFDDGKIKRIPKKSQKLTLEQVKDFFQSFSNDLYRDIARLQFLTGCRIQEIAGIKKSSIDLKNRRIVIKDVVVWGRDRKVLEIKPYTKNGENKIVTISDDTLWNVILEYYSKSKNGFLFEDKGNILKYRSIQHHYKKALDRAGIEVNSSTHFLRHSMASITRQMMGSIDAVQSVTGHKSVKLAEHYAGANNTLQADALSTVANELW